MKKIILIGDSIRMGYDKYVKEALKNSAEVYYPGENCRFAEYVLRYAHEWAKVSGFCGEADLVHWNAGLWDCLELFDDGPLTSIEYYKETIARIDRRLRMLFPKAKMIFATSTPVLEHKCSPDFRRHNSIIEKYNEAAIKALKNTGAKINDLYALIEKCPETYYSDFVHLYTNEGTQLLGNKVLETITTELGISTLKVEMKTFKPEEYSKENIGG